MMDRDINEKSVSDSFHEEDSAKLGLDGHETARRGAILEETERQMGYLAYVKYHRRPLLCCTRDQNPNVAS